MKLNCKAGDLAVIVSNGHAAYCPELIGRVVSVVRLMAPGEVFAALDGTRTPAVPWGPAWVIEASTPLPWAFVWADGSVVAKRLFAQRAITDELLRPLRDSDGEDEMLRIAGKPHVWLELEGLL